MDGGDPAGGSGVLAKLIDQAGEAILADFQHEYGLNLVNMMKDGSGYDPFHILMLIRQLPLESRTLSMMRGGEQFIGWGVDRYMNAQLIDGVNQVAYAVVASNSKRKPKAPKPVERPSRRKKVTNDPLRARLAAAKKAQGG